MWEDDKASGPGTLEYANGDKYRGEWENDQRNGKWWGKDSGSTYLYILG